MEGGGQACPRLIWCLQPRRKASGGRKGRAETQRTSRPEVGTRAFVKHGCSRNLALFGKAREVTRACETRLRVNLMVLQVSCGSGLTLSGSWGKVKEERGFCAFLSGCPESFTESELALNFNRLLF